MNALRPASLYRTYLREICVLPHDYLRLFFRLKASDDLRALGETICPSVWKSREKRVVKDLKRLRAANGGDVKAWKRILDLATGRKGKLRHELLEPIVHDPTAKPHPRIIPAVEKSRPPSYTPELTSLLTSPFGRGPGPLKRDYIDTPLSMPERGRPGSRDAELIGPLSKRREVNVRWRAYTNEVSKVIPALELGIQEGPRNVAPISKSPEDVARHGLRSLGMQGSGLFEDIVTVSRSTHEYEPMTRRQKKRLEDTGVDTSNALSNQGRPPRFFRRRYQSLLSRLPVLTHHPRAEAVKDKDNKDKNDKDRKDSQYSVGLHRYAIMPGVRFKVPFTREVSAIDLEWINPPSFNPPSEPSGSPKSLPPGRDS